MCRNRKRPEICYKTPHQLLLPYRIARKTQTDMWSVVSVIKVCDGSCRIEQDETLPRKNRNAWKVVEPRSIDLSSTSHGMMEKVVILIVVSISLCNFSPSPIDSTKIARRQVISASFLLIRNNYFHSLIHAQRWPRTMDMRY